MATKTKKVGGRARLNDFENAVRFSFTLPPGEAETIEILGADLRRKTGHLILRSELIRAALLAFVGLTGAEQLKILAGVERLKKARKT